MVRLGGVRHLGEERLAVVVVGHEHQVVHETGEPVDVPGRDAGGVADTEIDLLAARQQAAVQDTEVVGPESSLRGQLDQELCDQFCRSDIDVVIVVAPLHRRVQLLDFLDGDDGHDFLLRSGVERHVCVSLPIIYHGLLDMESNKKWPYSESMAIFYLLVTVLG